MTGTSDMPSDTPSLRDLFDVARELRGDPLRAFLDGIDAAQRPHLERLLAAADRGDEVLAGDPASLAAALEGPASPPHPVAGQHVGAWKLLALIGEGGSSTVFRAVREHAGVRQEAALKLLRRALYTADAQRQFRRERQALAQLDHPAIARLIEGGATDTGLAYIVLELVDGTPITEYACRHALDPGARLQLFLQACRAVEAAHRALIVHRDLKPANVFVSADGCVKLLDFGIAKLLDDDETQTRLPVFTPAYAAPEQRSDGPVTTATDVYALGILLGELLTGQRLNDGRDRTPSSRVDEAGASAALPATPRATRRLLRGDLDNIVLKAIAEEPERRYASAGALADDIEHLLEGRPVSAHPPSRVYRVRKFVQRHRGGVAATVLVMLAMLAAFVLTLWQANVARREAARAEAMHDFMTGAFREAEPGVPREGPPRITEVVQQAIDKARADPRMDASVRAELLTELGAVMRNQGKPAQAREVLQWNYDRAARDFGASHRLALNAGNELAQTLILVGDFSGARERLDDLLAHTSADDAARADLLHSSALLDIRQHDVERALRDSSAALRIDRTLGDDERLTRALGSLGNVQMGAHDYAGAAASSRDVLERRITQYGPEHMAVATAHANLSRALRLTGDLDGAVRHARAALAVDEKVLPRDDWRRARHLNALIMALRAQNDYAGALEAARESLRINRAVNGDDHLDTLIALDAVGMLHTLQGDYASAVLLLREGVERSTTKFGAEHYDTAVTRAKYGYALALSGDARTGEAELIHALASLEAAAQPDTEAIADARDKLARVRSANGATSPRH